MYWIAFGDVHEQTESLSRIPGLREADGVIVSGDLTNRGGTAQARQVLDAIRALNPRVLAQIGNMDGAAVHDFLQAEGLNIHLEARELAPGLGLMGVGWSTPTPFGTPSETSDGQIGQWLEQTHAKAAGFEHLVAVIHTPPLNTAADRLGSGASVGSLAVRNFLEKTQPEVCLTGHIHESRAQDRIGRTLVINPGMLAHGGYARLDYEDGRLSARLLTAP